MKDENLENTVVTLHGQGWSIRRFFVIFGDVLT